MNGKAEAALWYCIRTQRKREHIAAAQLGRGSGLEVLAPRLSRLTATRQGKRHSTTALFPCYIFVKFNLQAHLKLVRYSLGVKDVVRMGGYYVSVPTEVIDQLKALLDGGEEIIQEAVLAEGDVVRVVQGPFYGFTARVLRTEDSAKRVGLLFELLGRNIEVRVHRDACLLETVSGFAPQRA